MLVALKWHRWSWRRGVMVHWRPGSSRRPSPKDSLSIDPSSPTSHTLHTLDPHQDYFYYLIVWKLFFIWPVYDPHTMGPHQVYPPFSWYILSTKYPKVYFLSIAQLWPVSTVPLRAVKLIPEFCENTKILQGYLGSVHAPIHLHEHTPHFFMHYR